jgi:hypothetical protein
MLPHQFGEGVFEDGGRIAEGFIKMVDNFRQKLGAACIRSQHVMVGSEFLGDHVGEGDFVVELALRKADAECFYAFGAVAGG